MGSDLLEGRQTGLDYDCSSLGAVNFNTGIAGIERADAILLIGTNPRFEAPLVNTRIRKAVRRGAKVFVVGHDVNLTYNHEWLGSDASLLAKLPEAAHETLSKAERPAVIIGGAGLKAKGAHGAALAMVKTFNLVRESWNGFNALHMSASRMGGLMLGYAQKGGIADVVAADPELMFLLGADEVDCATLTGLKVFVGHHGDKGAHLADVILPAASYAEKPGTYVNLEGRVQRSERAVFPPGDAREDWTIFRALSDVLGQKLPFDTLDGLRAAMATEVPALGQEGPCRLRLVRTHFTDRACRAKWARRRSRISI